MLKTSCTTGWNCIVVCLTKTFIFFSNRQFIGNTKFVLIFNINAKFRKYQSRLQKINQTNFQCVSPALVFVVQYSDWRTITTS